MTTLQTMAEMCERSNGWRAVVASDKEGSLVRICWGRAGSIGFRMPSLVAAENAKAVLDNPLSLVLAANGIEP